MFSISLHPILLFLFILEGVLLFSQLLLVIARPQDVSRKRFLVLVFFFFQFTAFCGTMPSANLPISIFTQTVIVYLSSIILACGYFRYLITEFELPQLKMYSIKVLLISLFIAFFLFFFITYITTRDLYLSRIVFNLIPILVSFYFCFQTVYFLTQKWRRLKNGDSHHGTIILAGNVGIIFMATMPITDIFDKTLNQVLNVSLVSVSLLVTYFAYIRNHIYQSRLEFQYLDKNGFLDNYNNEVDFKEVLTKYNLTARELEVALFITEGKTYREIGDHMFLNHKTISKHSSNLFKKTNCENKIQFIDFFSNNEAQS